jgi:hypothetical protein
MKAEDCPVESSRAATDSFVSVIGRDNIASIIQDIVHYGHRNPSRGVPKIERPSYTNRGHIEFFVNPTALPTKTSLLVARF